MKKKDREIRDELLRIAKSLPFNYTEANATVKMKGSEIKADKDGDGNEIEPDKEYLVGVVQRRPVNHFKRMLRIHRTKGIQGVADYVTGVISLELEANLVERIGGIGVEYD